MMTIDSVFCDALDRAIPNELDLISYSCERRHMASYDFSVNDSLSDVLEMADDEISETESSGDIKIIHRRRKSDMHRHFTVGHVVSLIVAGFTLLGGLGLWTLGVSFDARDLAHEAVLAAQKAAPDRYTGTRAAEEWSEHSVIHEAEMTQLQRQMTASTQLIQASITLVEERLNHKVNTLERPPKWLSDLVREQAAISRSHEKEIQLIHKQQSELREELREAQEALAGMKHAHKIREGSK